MKKHFTRKSFLALFIAMMMLVTVLAGCSGKENDTASANKTSEGTNTTSGSQSGTAANANLNSDLDKNDKTQVDNTVRIAHYTVAGRDPQTYDPVNPNVDGGVIISMMYEYLFEPFDGTEYDHPHAELADQTRGEFGGYDHEAGSNEYIVYIYDYITDTAGNKITADDVLFCLNRYLTENSVTNWNDFEKCEVIDDTTLKFTFKSELTKAGDFKKYFNAFLVYSEEGYKNSKDGLTLSSCGTNRYYLKDVVPGVSCTLARRDDYWQTEELTDQLHQANIDEIEFQFISETSQQIMALKSGSVDMIPELDAQYLEDLVNDPNFVISSYEDNLTYGFYPNCDPSSPCSDVNLRKAIMYAIDTNNIALGLSEGSVQTLPCFANPNFAHYNPDWATTLQNNYHVSSDPELVKKYLEASSYNGEELRFVIGTNEMLQNTAIIIQTMLENYGIHSTITALDRSASSVVVNDPTAWDIRIQMGASTTGGTGGMFENSFDTRSTTKVNTLGQKCTANYFYDEEFQKLLELCLTVEGETDENLTKLEQMTLDNAYVMALYRPVVNTVARSNLASIARMYKFWVYVGACTFKAE